MALPNSAIQREYRKFVEDSSGDVAVRQKVTESAPEGRADSVTFFLTATSPLLSSTNFRYSL